MVELLIYPTITGIVTGIIIVLFEYYYVIPNKENQDSDTSSFKPSFSLKFILAVFAGVIIFELIIRTFFPKFNISTELLGGILNDSNITFASIFYVCFTSILLTFQSRSKFLYFIGTHLTPYLCLIWWTFTFTKVFRIFESTLPDNTTSSSDTILPIVHNLLLCWIFYGLRAFFKNLDYLAILAAIIFPLNALFLLNYTSNVGAWGGALITTACIVGFIMEESISLKEKEKAHNQSRPTYSSKKL